MTRQTTVRQDRMERIALGASLLCLVHCLALPVAIAMLPAFGNVATLPHEAHVWLLAFVAPATGTTLLSGYRSHRHPRPLAVGAAGLALIAIAALLLLETAWETPLTVAGSLMIVIAHGANWTLRHASKAAGDCQYDGVEEAP